MVFIHQFTDTLLLKICFHRNKFSLTALGQTQKTINLKSCLLWPQLLISFRIIKEADLFDSLVSKRMSLIYGRAIELNHLVPKDQLLKLRPLH